MLKENFNELQIFLVSFDEFLRALRGDLNECRIGFIRQAYDKLDVNKDG